MGTFYTNRRVIGSGKPGALTRQLVADYRALTKVSGEPIQI